MKITGILGWDSFHLQTFLKEILPLLFKVKREIILVIIKTSAIYSLGNVATSCTCSVQMKLNALTMFEQLILGTEIYFCSQFLNLSVQLLD
jgi:hypothetical protein